jgi:3-oxoacyl-[acyl-carrier-protein] synthase II
MTAAGTTAAQAANGRRVVITGIGAVTPIGSRAEGLWSGVLCARSAVGPITQFDAAPFECRIGAEIPDFDPADYLEGKALKRLDRCAQLAVAAGKQAIADAKLDLTREDPARCGVCIGSALGGAAQAERQHARYMEAGPRAVSPMLALQVFVGASSCNLAIELGLTGYSSSNADSCASGPIALGNARHVIRRGDADVMLAGGAEAPFAPLCFGAFSIIRAMSTRNDDPAHACRPFDRERDGFVMGEGAAVLVLEEREHALRRGATVYAELAGFACTNDAHHMTAPRPDAAAAARCIRDALSEAQVAPEEIDYVNAHGSSTPRNDPTETLALKAALGEETARRVPISSTKAMHAHALGATGAMEAAICCLAMRHHWIPPTINYEFPDPECDLDYVPNVGRAAALHTVLSDSFGFGGINAALVLRRDSAL